MDVNTDRQARIAGLRAGAASLRKSAERLSTALADGLPAEVPDPGVHLFFGPDGVVESVQIDDQTRASCTGAELLHKVTLAFAAAPVPAAVTRRLVGDPEALRAIRDRGPATSPATYTSVDGAVTLVAVLGRPVEVRGVEGMILSRSAADLGASIVALARRAATEEGMGDA
ncbi:hypothetical protein [uncultured Microbacterium sp.]|uniref:hypothetical protein n=1 Tax=uncultured Microbacterium sp. TaxID=191216 RepID=UPI0025F8222C|nr:hypothetical protein [uncultured Microbacterium sp.]